MRRGCGGCGGSSIILFPPLPPIGDRRILTPLRPLLPPVDGDPVDGDDIDKLIPFEPPLPPVDGDPVDGELIGDRRTRISRFFGTSPFTTADAAVLPPPPALVAPPTHGSVRTFPQPLDLLGEGPVLMPTQECGAVFAGRRDVFQLLFAWTAVAGSPSAVYIDGGSIPASFTLDANARRIPTLDANSSSLYEEL